MQTYEEKKDQAELTRDLYETAMRVNAETYLKYVGFTQEELDTHCTDVCDLWILYKKVSEDLGFDLENLLQS